MYFSNFNKQITYSNRWGSLAVEGKGKVCKEDLDVFPCSSKKWMEKYRAVSLEKGITAVGEGFLEAFKRIDTLVIHHTVKSIDTTPSLLDLLRGNRVVIRGWYESFGERFAMDNGLKFIHSDIVVGWAHDEEHFTNTRLEIRFDDKGKPYRFYDDVCPGISAGNNGGGTYTRELDADFYVGQTLESFAGWLPRFSDAILQNKDLKRFFETAGKRGGKSRK